MLGLTLGTAVTLQPGMVRGQCQVSFGPAATYPSGVQTRGIAVGNLNSDGLPDIAVTYDPLGGGPDYVRLLINNPGGALQLAGSYEAGLGPWGVAISDLNNDGRADLAVAKDGGGISILIGNGDGTFLPYAHYPALDYAWCIAVGEFNGDGKRDLAVSGATFNPGDSVFILLGNGDGSFQPPVGYWTWGTSQFHEVAIGDFNGDGKSDLAVTNEDANGVFVLPGNGDGSFQAATHYPAGHEPTSVVVLDLNRDGKLDLAVGSFDLVNQGRVAVLLNVGDGAFQPALFHSFTSSDNEVRLAPGDFDSDGNPDLAVANRVGGVTILPGRGDGTFEGDVFFATNPVYGGARRVAVGDFNADARPDVAATFIGSGWAGAVEVLLNTACFADCNRDCVLTVADFGCFQTKFVQQEPYADCNRDSLLTIADFACFQTSFVAGCS